MKRSLRLLLAALLCWAGSICPAAAAELKEVVATLERGYQTLTDLQADFVQRTAIGSLKREEKGSGELLLKRGSGGAAMFRFNYVKPRQQIVSNGKSVWYYLPENRQVLVADAATLFSGGNAIALSYLTGLGHISRDFTITFAGDGRDARKNFVLELVPKKPTQAMSKLQLTVSAEAVEQYVATGTAAVPFPILTSVLFDTIGNRTTIDYSRIRVNRGLASERFAFKIPAGVEVIKQ
jgi:outer membrane lipoprotein carrier protein